MAGFDENAFWAAVLAQDKEAIRRWFLPEATVRWHCTGEEFTVEEYLRANCEYPGSWTGEVVRREAMGELLVTVARVRSREGGAACHAVTFFRLAEGRIRTMDEYWGDDGPPPAWRQAMGIGKAIPPGREE